MLPFLETMDLGALFWFQSIHTAWLDQIMLAASHLGDRPFLLGLVVAAALVLALREQARTAGLLVLALGLAFATTEGAKRLVARPRPENANPVVVPAPTGPGFPSAHATLSMTVYGCLAVVLARRQTRRGMRILIGAAAAVVILLIGFSRLYLCVHYVTDVWGGWCAGLGFVMFFLWADQLVAPQAQPSMPIPPQGAPTSRSLRGSGFQI
jgi:undecaprenyl-diphosphatase